MSRVCAPAKRRTVCISQVLQRHAMYSNQVFQRGIFLVQVFGAPNSAQGFAHRLSENMRDRERLHAVFVDQQKFVGMANSRIVKVNPDLGAVVGGDGIEQPDKTHLDLEALCAQFPFNVRQSTGNLHVRILSRG